MSQGCCFPPAMWLKTTWPTPLPQVLLLILTSFPAFPLQELILSHFPFWIPQHLSTCVNRPILGCALIVLESCWLSQLCLSSLGSGSPVGHGQAGPAVPRADWLLSARMPLRVPKFWTLGCRRHLLPPCVPPECWALSCVIWRSLYRAQTAPPCCDLGIATCPHRFLLPAGGVVPALCCHHVVRTKVTIYFPLWSYLRHKGHVSP